MKKFALVAVLACLAGCQPHPNTAPVPMRGDPVNINNYPMIEVEQVLGAYVVGSEPRITRDGGVMKVVTPIRFEVGDPAHDLAIQYRYTFFDANGVPLREQTDYKYMKIMPRTQVFLDGNALDGNAEGWRLFVRLAR